jgi:acetyl-CoA acetyltransferase
MGLGPVSAIRQLHEKSRLAPKDADTIELNEAFAGQALSVLKVLDAEGLTIPRDRLNPHGGAIALGHPVGASGARLVLTALRQLRETGGRRALVTLCVGGGQGAALWFEAP